MRSRHRKKHRINQGMDILFSTPVLGGCLVLFTLLLYHRALGFGLNSDAFILLKNAVEAPLSWDHSYHYMPLTASWIRLQHVFFGLHQESYELLNVIQHGIIATMVFLFARRLGLQQFEAFFAGLLFAGAGSAYQVVLWSIVGSNYFVSTFLYLLALILFLRTGSRRNIWLCTAIFALALLAHEQSLSLYPACILASFFLGDPGADHFWKRWKSHLFRSLRETLPMLGPTAVFLLSKYLMSLQTDVLGPRRSPGQVIQDLSSGIIQLWSFRGDINLGLEPIRFLEVQQHALAILVLGMLITTLLLMRLSPVSRFLLLWSCIHLLMMDLATGIAIRHLYIPTAAASIALLEFTGGILSRHFSTVTTRVLISSLLLMILWPSISDIHSAQIEWQRADRMTKRLYTSVHRLSRNQKQISRVVILNAGSEIQAPSFQIFSFKNGLRSLVALASHGQISRVLIAHTAEHENNANGSNLITMPEVARLLTDRSTAAFSLDDTRGEVTRLNLRELRKQGLLAVHSPWVEMATPATRPELDWVRHRRRPKIMVSPRQKIETFLTPPTRNAPWFLITWKMEENIRFDLRVGKTWHDVISTQHPTGWGSTLEVLPNLHGEPIRIPVSIHNRCRIPLRISIFGFFRPRRLLNAQTGPEFIWDHENVLEIPVASELKLPAPDDGPSPVVQIVSSNDERRSIELRSESGRKLKLKNENGSTSPWLILNADLPDTRWISVHATGTRAAQILQIWFPRPGELNENSPH